MDRTGYEKIAERLSDSLGDDVVIKPPVPKEGEDIRFISVSSAAGTAAILNALDRIPGVQDGFLERLGAREGLLRPELAIAGMPDPTTVTFHDVNCR